MTDKATIFKGRKARIEVLSVVRPDDPLPEPEEVKPNDQPGGDGGGPGGTGGGVDDHLGEAKPEERLEVVPESGDVPSTEPVEQPPAEVQPQEVPASRPRRSAKAATAKEEVNSPPVESEYRPKRRF